MAESTQSKHPFISWLEKLRDDRGALAALRRGLGQAAGTVPDMYPYVVPLLPKTPNRDLEEVYYLIASLFAYHPESATAGNFGDHFRTVANIEREHSDAIERRFAILLRAHPDDLPTLLRQAVDYLRSKNIPINWDQLLNDLLRWSSPSRFVQRRWANAFWGSENQPSV